MSIQSEEPEFEFSLSSLSSNSLEEIYENVDGETDKISVEEIKEVKPSSTKSTKSSKSDEPEPMAEHICEEKYPYAASKFMRFLFLIGMRYRIVIDNADSSVCSIQRKILFVWKNLIDELPIGEAKTFMRELDNGTPFSQVNADRKFIHYVQYVRSQAQKNTQDRIAESCKNMERIAKLSKENSDLKKETEKLIASNTAIKAKLEQFQIRLSEYETENPISSIKL